MAYFRCGGNEKHYATIAVTTDYLFGETVTCTCADVGYSRTATFSDDGEAKFTVNDWGRYTITSGDHASIIDVSAWYVTYEVDFAGSMELNLTLEGAMNDTITIKDSTGATVGTCIFNNSTTGQTRITTPLTGGEYTFVSSVSKALDGSGADYSKTVTITQGSTTVRVLPDGALYWYGNECTDVTGGWSAIDGTNWTEWDGAVYEASLVSKGINALTNIAYTSLNKISGFVTNQQFSSGTYSKAKCFVNRWVENSNAYGFVELETTNKISTATRYSMRVSRNYTSDNIYSVNIPSSIDVYGVSFGRNCQSGTNLFAMWLE